MNTPKHPRYVTLRRPLRALARSSVALALSLVLAGSLSAATLLNDTFADGERSTQNPPSSAAWFGSSSSSPLAVSANALAQPPATTGLAYFTPAGAPLALAVGDTLAANFTLRLAGSAFPTSNDFLRIALLNSSGTSADRNATGAAQRISADVYNTGTTAFANNAGYMATAAINPASAAAIKIYAHNFNATGGVTGTGSYTALGSTAGTGAYGFLSGNTYSGSLTVRRATSTSTEVTLAFSGTFAGGSGGTWTRTHTDSSTATRVFDLLAFYLSSGGSLTGLTLDNIAVTHTPALAAPAITSATSATAGAGSPFTYQITASGSPTSYAASGLPAGLSLDPATGRIEGRPTASGSSSVTISATNAAGTGSATLSLSVAAAPAAQTTVAAFKTAIGGAGPGSVVVLANGTYTNFGYYKVAKSGAAGQPLVIRAQTPGGVVFNGDFQIETSGSHVILDGFRIRGDARPANDYAYPAASSGVFKLYGADNRITECSINGFNRAAGPTKWVQVKGDRHRVDHCHFASKSGQGQMLEVILDGTTDNHRIDHNVFRDFAYGNGDNEYETLRLGSGALAIGVASASVVEKNYFDACDGEIETISVKSSDCAIRDNTLVNCRGTITLRQGKRNLVTGNVLLNLAAKTESGGIRVCNSDHEIRDNYVYGARTASSQHMGGIVITASDVDPAADPATYAYDKHWPVKDVLVQSNSLINCQQSFVHGGGYPYNPVSVTFLDNCARNNLSGDGSFNIVRVIKAITTPAYAGERYYGSPSGFTAVPAGVDATNDPVVTSTVINGYTLYFAPGGAGTDAAHVYPLQASNAGPLAYTP